jgi:hypothetical protein
VVLASEGAIGGFNNGWARVRRYLQRVVVGAENQQWPRTRWGITAGHETDLSLSGMSSCVLANWSF